MARNKKQFCVNGHDVFIVGRDSTGHCNECVEERKPKRAEYNKEYYIRTQDKQLVRARKYRAENPEKIKEYNDKYMEEHKEELLEKWKAQYDPQKAHEWYLLHKEEANIRSKEWRKNNPELVKAHKIRSVTNRSLRVPMWADWNLIEDFYRNCPDQFDVDHIIPLLGKLVSGLHVSWNLQYLTHNLNSSKQNKIDLVWASEQYGKILEEAGLK